MWPGLIIKATSLFFAGRLVLPGGRDRFGGLHRTPITIHKTPIMIPACRDKHGGRGNNVNYYHRPVFTDEYLGRIIGSVILPGERPTYYIEPE